MFTLKFRRGTAARWAETNPILDAGEPGYETDTDRFKIGDGFTRWLDLPTYLSEDALRVVIGDIPTGGLPEHINDPEPHPAYDDGPSFLLLYQNAKV